MGDYKIYVYLALAIFCLNLSIMLFTWDPYPFQYIGNAFSEFFNHYLDTIENISEKHVIMKFFINYGLPILCLIFCIRLVKYVLTEL